MKKITKDLLIILSISLLIRLLFPFGKLIFKDNYHFVGSWIPYFFDPDSYFYLRIMQQENMNLLGIFILPILSFLLGLIIFYFLLKYLKIKNLQIYCLLLSLFPLLYSSTIIGNVDTPSYIFLIYISIIYVSIVILKYYNELNWRDYLMLFTLITILFLLLSLIWNKSGVFMLVSIFIFSISLAFIRELRYKILFMFGAALFFFLMVKDKMMSFFSLSGEIQELNHLDFPLYALFSVLALISVIDLWQKEKKDIRLYEYLIYSYIVLMFLSFMMKRFAYLSVIYGVIMLALSSKKKIMDYIVLFMICISIFHISISINEYPLIERNVEQAISALDDYQIIGDWGYGHIYQAFAKGQVLFKGHPDMAKVDLWRKAISSGDYYLFDKLNTSKIYYVIISNHDNKYVYDVEGFKIINVSFGNQTSITILQRGVTNRTRRDIDFVWKEEVVHP